MGVQGVQVAAPGPVCRRWKIWPKLLAANSSILPSALVSAATVRIGASNGRHSCQDCPGAWERRKTSSVLFIALTRPMERRATATSQVGDVLVGRDAR